MINYRNIITAVCLALSSTAMAQKEHNFEVAKNIDIFNALYRELDMLYVDTLDAKKVIGIGIDAMLSNLDPYTEFYAEEDMRDLKIMTTGKYGGIGSIIRLRKDSAIRRYASITRRSQGGRCHHKGGWQGNNQGHEDKRCERYVTWRTRNNIRASGKASR